MKNLIELSHTEVVLAFAASCIESTARHLGKSYHMIECLTTWEAKQ